MTQTKDKSAAKPAKRPAGAAVRLDSKAWVDAALNILAQQGIAGVRVETLAKQLGVTKGSFYWHFKDRDALFDALLDSWRRQATLRIIARLDETGQSAAGRLLQLLQLPFQGPRSGRAANVELALRLWGRENPRAHAILVEVDQLRLHYIAQLLEDCGFAAAEAKARAVLAYAFIRVGTTMIDAEDHATLAACHAIIVNKAN